MANAIRIHGFPLSGHSHRVELFAALAGIAYELVDVDLTAGAHLRQPFLSLNPFGQVPALEDGAVVLADSNAILVYLAKRYAPGWLPEDPEGAARVQRFLSVAAGEINSGPATARVAEVFGLAQDTTRARELAHWIFARLEVHLADRAWLAADRPTIADVAIYSYTAHAPEGNVPLDPYPNLRAWLARVEALPGFVAMPASRPRTAA